MTGEKVQIFLEDGLRQSAQAGAHNFLRLVGEVLHEAGLEPEFRPMGARHSGQGLTLTHMKPPASERGLVFRRVYHYPFWQIEQTDKRWDWDVAKATFEPAQVDGQEARRFRTFWRGRLFPGLEARDGDTIYVPLQGKLTQHRSFQRCAPLDMLRVVAQATDRPVIATFHPKESYTQTEREAVADLVRAYPHLTCETGGMEQHLPACHCVVTQNSSAAFNGYFFGKPAILLADIDFHHIARVATLESLPETLGTPAPRVQYAKYLWWFWQDQSINAGRAEVKEKIHARFQRFGWIGG